MLRSLFPLPDLHLYNSLGRKMERLVTRRPGEVQLYTCGPTIYDHVHIGNLRTFIFEDLLRRTLKLFGYKVKQVMNLTDVDDKTIRGAIRAGKSLRDFTDPYAKTFFEDIDALRIERAEIYPRATDYIPAMIEMIETLIQKGYAYQSPDNSVYFSIERYHDYGRLCQLATRLDSRSRLQNDEYEKDVVGDFVLWKAYDSERDGFVFWQSPWGKGRPGWHIECSAMAKALLGEQIDIHTGGIDNLFPHHENEKAQSECCNHQPMARYWLHSEHLLVESKKMSKSLGNFFTLRDLLLKSYDPLAIRYLLLQTHYRHSLNFTLDGLKASARSLERLRDFHFRLTQESRREDLESGSVEEVKTSSQRALQRFFLSLADDLNISAALAAVFEWVSEFHRFLDHSQAKKGDCEMAIAILHEFDRVLGVIEPPASDNLESQVQEWYDQRLNARAAKNWALSDQLRLKIEAAGYLIEDSPQGSRLKAQIKLGQ